MRQAGGQTRPIGAVDFTPEPTVSEIEVFLLANEVVRTDGSRLFRTRVNGTDEQYVNPLATEDGMPGYAIQWIEIEGPFYDDPAGGAGYRAVVRRLAAGALGAGADGRAAGDRPEPIGRPGAGGRRRVRGGPGRGRPPCARRSTKSNPRHRGRMPSGCCDRS